MVSARIFVRIDPAVPKRFPERVRNAEMLCRQSPRYATAFVTGQGEGAVMTRHILWALAVITCVSGNAFAQNSLREQLNALGQRACMQVWNAGGLEGVDFAKQATANSLTQADYCGCVGTLFESQTGGPGDENAEAFMQRLIVNTMTTCLTETADDGVVEDGDLGPEDFAFDPSDVKMCEMALEDAILMPGFRADEVIAQLERTGQTRDDLCTCAARYFTAGGEPLQQEIENAHNSNVVYGSTMAGAINTCLID
jgi:hypothetical protein